MKRIEIIPAETGSIVYLFDGDAMAASLQYPISSFAVYDDVLFNPDIFMAAVRMVADFVRG